MKRNLLIVISIMMYLFLGVGCAKNEMTIGIEEKLYDSWYKEGDNVPSFILYPQYFFSTIQTDSNGNIDGLLYGLVVLSYMEMYSIHEDNGVFLFQRTILPFFCNRKNSVCHVGYHLCRSIHTINGFQMRGDITGSHAFCVHG